MRSCMQTVQASLAKATSYRRIKLLSIHLEWELSHGLFHLISSSPASGSGRKAETAAGGGGLGACAGWAARVSGELVSPRTYGACRPQPAACCRVRSRSSRAAGGRRRRIGAMRTRRVNLLIALVAVGLFSFSCFCISRLTQTSERRLASPAFSLGSGAPGPRGDWSGRVGEKWEDVGP